MDPLIDTLIAAVRADDYDAIAAARTAIDSYITDYGSDRYGDGYGDGYSDGSDGMD